MLNFEQFKSHINRKSKDVKVVSFDIFDTLLLRMIPPGRVAQLAAEELNRQLAAEELITLSASEIINSRRKFKQQKDRAYLYQESEWTLSEWLCELAKQHSLDPSILCRLSRQAELSAESKSLYLAPDAIKSISLAKDQDLQVIAISDMWLDQEWLKDLLAKFGLHFDAVFSSGSLGVSKRRGTIFKFIEANLALKAKNFIHLGDNLKADFLRPCLAGWKSIWIPHPGNSLQIRALPVISRYRPKRKPWKDIVQALNIVSISTEKKSDPYFELAYEHLAPLLIIFSIIQWRKFREQNIDQVFYIARDAKAMFDVYNTIEHLLPGSCPRHYIRLSRRTVAIAHPDNLLQNVTHIAGKVGKKKVREWLSNFTISSELRNKILLSAKVNEKDDFTESVHSSLQSACSKLLPLIIAEQNIQKQIIKDYLLQQAPNLSYRRIGIVDSGWACTTQDSIRAVLNDSELINGIYLGVSSQGHKPNRQNLKYGLLRDDFRRCPHHNPLESTAGVIRLWDTILREPCETVLELHRQPDNKVEPILVDETIFKDLEYKAADSINQGIFKGTSDRLKSVSLIVELSENFTDADFETAATMIAKNISSQPTSSIAKAIIRLGFDEGAADGGKRTLSGINGIKDGVAWYPGILSSMGLKWVVPLMEVGASKILKNKLKQTCQIKNEDNNR